MNFEWKGVMPAVTTKFTSDDQLDLDLFNKNIRAQVDAGVSAIVLGGTLGEASTLAEAEKQQLTESAVAHVGQEVPVILNIAEQTTKGAVQAAVNAKHWGGKRTYDATTHAVQGYRLRNRGLFPGCSPCHRPAYYGV